MCMIKLLLCCIGVVYVDIRKYLLKDWNGF